jgi:cyclase
MVVAIDAKYEAEEDTWIVYTHGGRERTEWKVLDWAKHVVELGAGEILLTSMDQDGQKNGDCVDVKDFIRLHGYIPEKE